MSFYKEYPNRKDNRRKYPFSGGKAICSSCQNNGSCSYCKGNRTHKNNRKEYSSREQIREFET